MQFSWAAVNPTLKSRDIDLHRASLTATSLSDNEIVFAFGEKDKSDLSTRPFFKDIILYDQAQNSLSKLNVIVPYGRSSHCAASYTNHGFFFGGLSNTGYSNELLHLAKNSSGDYKLEAYAPSPNWPAARRHAAMTCITRQLAIHGGSDAAKQYDDLWVFDVESAKMHKINPRTSTSPGERVGHTLFTDTASNLLVLIGSNPVGFVDAFIFDPRACIWIPVTTEPSTLSLGRQLATVSILSPTAGAATSTISALMLGGRPFNTADFLPSSDAELLLNFDLRATKQVQWQRIPLAEGSETSPFPMSFHAGVECGPGGSGAPGQLVVGGIPKNYSQPTIDMMMKLTVVGGSFAAKAPVASPARQPAVQPPPSPSTPPRVPLSPTAGRPGGPSSGAPLWTDKKAPRATTPESGRRTPPPARGRSPPRRVTFSESVKVVSRDAANRVALSLNISHAVQADRAHHESTVTTAQLVSPMLLPSLHEKEAALKRMIKAIKDSCTRYDGYEEGRTGFKFPLNVPEVRWLCEEVSPILMSDPSVIRIEAPCKIFGDLHGQIHDLMTYFTLFGDIDEDIADYRYVFLGDYVDRGFCGMHIVCLLFCYKILHPSQVVLLRGNHEDEEVNVIYGFLEECKRRFGADGESVWQLVNETFNRLPLACEISRSIFCVHGGLGPKLTRVSDLEAVKRPLKSPSKCRNPVVTEALWSDPSESYSVQGYIPSARGAQDPIEFCQFGVDVVKQFCEDNSIDVIVRGHEYPMDGFELFANGHLVTCFSATNYCGEKDNCGAMLLVSSHLKIMPKVVTAGPLQQFEFLGGRRAGQDNVSPPRGSVVASSAAGLRAPVSSFVGRGR